jgi:uroporphyrinogen decarboxylase
MTVGARSVMLSATQFPWQACFQQVNRTHAPNETPMAYLGVVDDFRACIWMRTPSRVPVFALGQEVNQRLAELTCGQYRRDVDLVVRSEVDAIRRFDYDWGMIFPDDYVEFEPLGLRMRHDEDRPAMASEPLPLNRETLRRFRLPDPDSDMRLPAHLEMIRRLKAAVGDSACVFGRIAAPYTAPALIYGIEAWLIAMLDEPDLMRDNIAFFEDHQVAFGKAQLEAGADALWLGDCVADSAFISREHYLRFAFDPAARTIERLNAAGGLVIYHTGETVIAHLQCQAQLPPCAINVGEGICIADVKRACGRRRCFAGNFDPMLLRDGTPDQVAHATDRMVRENMPGGGYIFNTGEGVMYTTPAENVDAMMRAARLATDTFTPKPANLPT